jgi:hypothetical protein
MVPAETGHDTYLEQNAMVCGVAFTVSQPGKAGSVRSSELLMTKM